MKICMIGAGMATRKGRALSGAHTNNIAALAGELAKRGHEVHIISSYFPSHPFSTGEGVPLREATIHPVKAKGRYATMIYNLGLALKIILKVKELHKKENFDIIHGHSGYSGLVLVTGICGSMTNVPTVHTLYSPLKRTDASFPPPFFRKFYLRRLNKIVAISENVRNSFCSIMLDTRIMVIPPAVGPHFFNQNGAPPDVNPTLLFLGDASRIKGAETVIKALAHVAREFPKVRLIMGLDPSKEGYESGTSKRRAELEQQIKSCSLNANVTLLGLIKNVPQVMAASHIFITPFLSNYDAADYPLSLMEAMSMAKPVIASKIGGIPEIVKNGENGILVEPGDADSLAKAIILLLKDEDKRQMMGQKGRRFAESHFAAEQIAETTEEVYKELTTRATPKRA